jgi:hypothetical protein
VAYVSACIAAGLTVFVGVGGPNEPEFGNIVVEATLGIAAYTLVLTFIPMLVAIVAAELFAWRSVFAWLLVGAAIGLFALISIGQFTPGISQARPELYVAAGCVLGFVYWMIAGRLSGTPAARLPGADRADTVG